MAGLLSILVLVAGVACGGAHPEQQTTRVPGLTATLEQYREDEIGGLISVQATNRSSSVVRFENLRLEWSGLTSEEPYLRSTQISPGATLDLPVRQGDARCGDPPGAGSPPSGAALAVGDASIDGAPPLLVAIPVDDRRSILPRVFVSSCQDQRLRWAADLRFGASWKASTTTSGRPAVLGTIELRRRESGAALKVTRINGSVLLQINAVSPADPVVVLGPSQDVATIPIEIEESGNCAAHALAESKKTFIIPIGFAIGDDEPISYVITFDDTARTLLTKMINDSCGVG